MRTLITFFMTCALALAASGVAGTWKGTAKGSTEYDVQLLLAQDGDKITGNLEVAGASLAVENAKLTGDELTFKLDAGDATYTVKLTVNGDSMDGTYSGDNGESGTFTVRK